MPQDKKLCTATPIAYVPVPENPALESAMDAMDQAYDAAWASAQEAMYVNFGDISRTLSLEQFRHNQAQIHRTVLATSEEQGTELVLITKIDDCGNMSYNYEVTLAGVLQPGPMVDYSYRAASRLYWELTFADPEQTFADALEKYENKP